MKRRFVNELRVAGLLAVVFVAASDARAQIPQGSITVHTQVTASWLSLTDPNLGTELTPTDLMQMPDGTGRFLVATLGGQIRMLNGNAQLLSTPFMTQAQTNTFVPQESGMSGIALHADFANAGAFGFGKLYTITTEQTGTAAADFTHGGSGTEHQSVIREWDLSTHIGNANDNVFAGSVTASREIMRVNQPGPFHNFVDLAFDNSGFLLISSGDGGDTGGYNRFTAAQDRTNIYGNILRIDPDNTVTGDGSLSANGQYRIPTANPFVGNGSGFLEEIYAYGLRSPWRMTVDPNTPGTLWVGDVGEGSREEVSRITAGDNLGWGRFEGTLLRDAGISLPAGETHTPPVFEYGRSDGRTVVGGFVYRGSLIPELAGMYVFAELGQGAASGRLFYGDPNTGQEFEFQLSPNSAVFLDANDNPIPLPDRIMSIGEDQSGELYLVAGQDPRPHAPSAPGAFIVRLVPEPASWALAVCGLLLLCAVALFSKRVKSIP